MTNKHAIVGSYVLLGAATAVITVCRVIEYLNYQLKPPRAKARNW